MRNLSTKEVSLLGVLAMALIALWSGLPGDGKSLGRADGTAGTEVTHLGDPPNVPMELLGIAAAVYDRRGRNLFEYNGPRQPSRPAKISPPHVGVRPPRPIPPALPPQIVQPTPPRPAVDYIGVFGPKDDWIAVFARGAEVLVAQVGDVVDGGFELLEFRYNAVVLGRVGEENGSETVRLARK
jgi:hypothetical protein